MPKPKRTPRPPFHQGPGPHAQVRSLAPRAGHSTRTESVPCPSSIESSNGCDWRSFSALNLPCAIRRCRIAPAIGVTLLLKNVLLCREPLYGVGEWAARYAPEALGFADTQLPSLNDDRVGRCLDRLFRSDVTSLVLCGDACGPRVPGRPG